MSGSKARAARQAHRSSAPPRRSPRSHQKYWLSWRGGLVVVAVTAVIGASFVLPDALDSTESLTPHTEMTTGVPQGEGLTVGTPVPMFSEKDVTSGKAITSSSLYSGKTLLFFSEGVMCQACFEQIKGLEGVAAELRRRDVRLVSVTPDESGDLRQAVALYGITTPMIADTDRDMSAAFNTLGQGMHADTPGHAFVLVHAGKVLWYRDYWLEPTRSMYVEPERLLAEMPA